MSTKDYRISYGSRRVAKDRPHRAKDTAPSHADLAKFEPTEAGQTSVVGEDAQVEMDLLEILAEEHEPVEVG